jgi:hypothetical protein
MLDPDVCYDLTTVRKLEADNMGQEHWDDEDSIDYQDDNEEEEEEEEDDDGDGEIEDEEEEE